MHEDFLNELAVAKEAAEKAGAFLKLNRDNENKIISSSDKDIKLQADISSEKIIKDMIAQKSDYPILAEESTLSNENFEGTYWVVDPLDGTANYSRDIQISCVSVALIRELEPVLGVIFDFNSGDLYEGSIYSNALKNGEVIAVSKTKLPNEGILMTGLPNKTDYSDEALISMIKDFQKWKKVRMIGSAAMASTYVACGKADMYKEHKTYIWDIAAGAAIVNSAGGKVLISNQNEYFQVDVCFANSSIKT